MYDLGAPDARVRASPSVQAHGQRGLNAKTLLFPATRMRPLTAIGDVNRRTPANVSVPPPKTTAPVATSHAWILLVPSAPAVHTIASLPWASVVVMIGEPCPPLFAHHAVDSRVPLNLMVTRSPLPVGQPTPDALRWPCMVTNVPAGVVTAAEALTIWPLIAR